MVMSASLELDALRLGSHPMPRIAQSDNLEIPSECFGKSDGRFVTFSARAQEQGSVKSGWER